MKYTEEQARDMYESVAFNDSRLYAFFDGRYWHHPEKIFNNFNEFYYYIIIKKIKEVHAKPIVDNGGREWVIDVDFDESCDTLLQIKIDIACQVFKNFFKQNVSKIMHTGNRGIHVWLRIDEFRLSADKILRTRYYQIFKRPKVIVLRSVPKNSFMSCVVEAIASKSIDERIKNLMTNTSLNCTKCLTKQIYCSIDKTSNSMEKLVYLLWPLVDEHIFCNINSQIRMPFSFNCKSKKFSTQIQ
ncbi:LEF-1 [Urbanus proteus nucleopolyhedrovirus]|uniref:LEF-1 n=1 Tax=Urbanus proteus nucleopolyhedrovirus TaxID=1675866 RepID=A0A162GUB1_9ABAC|nr:LEF-1 [Urbanus proteus nucleopolyhedrovirus]AKR17330.1 LEF-1 [Urbanus proteus nucleopolyhedrovirus]